MTHVTSTGKQGHAGRLLSTLVALLLTILASAQPANNDPCGAAVLTPGATCTYTTGTNVAATATTGPPAPGCASYVGGDVWFRVTIPAGGAVTLTTATVPASPLTDGGMAVYTAPSCSGPFTLVLCNDDTNGLMPVINHTGAPGSTIWVRFWEFGNNAFGTFNICATSPASPCSAVNIPSLPVTNQAVACNGSNLITAANLSSICGTASTLYVGGNEALYTVTPATTGPYTISYTGQTYSSIWVYSAACPTAGGACVGSVSGTGSSQSLTVNLVAGVQYWVLFDTWPSPPSPCPGTFSISGASAAPANNDPCGATLLTAGTSCSFLPGSNSSATATIGPPAPTCASYLGGDVWFRVVVPASGQLTIDSNTGTLTDGGMALYTAPSCSGPFTQVACDDDASANGLMPFINATGLAPGSTVYIRFWGYGGTTGTFSLCAYGNTVTPPPGGCIYTLNLMDSFGDGWGTSAVGISINGGPYTWYSVAGISNTVSIPVSIGTIVAVQYNNSGTFQGENSYNITLSGGLLFASGSPPTAGLVWTNTVTCQPPAAPPEDCVGGITICSGQTFNNNTTNTGAVADLNLTSAGCLGALERQGTWYNFSPTSGGTVGFTINPSDPLDDYDFALWGPFPPGSNPSTICPPLGAPLRCSFAAPSGATGLNATAGDLTEGAGGDKWVQQLTVTPGQVYLLYISNFSQSGLSFGLTWQLGGGASLDCTVLPVELIALSATPADGQVLVDWTTASEVGTLHHEVERATDGVTFFPVGRVNAQGLAMDLTDYRFVDQGPADGLNYYRIRSVEADGHTSLSHTVTAWVGRAAQPVKVVPNPATEQAALVVHLTSDGTHLLRVLDAQGRVLLERSFPGNPGANTVALDLDRLVAGPYQAVVVRPDGEVVGRGRFVKQ